MQTKIGSQRGTNKGCKEEEEKKTGKKKQKERKEEEQQQGLELCGCDVVFLGEGYYYCSFCSSSLSSSSSSTFLLLGRRIRIHQSVFSQFVEAFLLQIFHLAFTYLSPSFFLSFLVLTRRLAFQTPQQSDLPVLCYGSSSSILTYSFLSLSQFTVNKIEMFVAPPQRSRSISSLRNTSHRNEAREKKTRESENRFRVRRQKLRERKGCVEACRWREISFLLKTISAIVEKREREGVVQRSSPVDFRSSLGGRDGGRECCAQKRN